MSRIQRPLLTWVVVGVLAALHVTNAMLFILLRTVGPLIGVAFYGALLTVAWRNRAYNHRPVMVGGLVGLAVHVVEVLALGWSAYPVHMALNLFLPAALALTAWLAGQRTEPKKTSE